MTITMSILKYANCLFGFLAFHLCGTIAYSQKADTLQIASLLKGITQTPKPRNYQNVDQLDRTADYIKKEFEKVEGELTFHFDTLSVLNLIIKYSISRFNLKRGFPFYFENQTT